MEEALRIDAEDALKASAKYQIATLAIAEAPHDLWRVLEFYEEDP